MLLAWCAAASAQAATPINSNLTVQANVVDACSVAPATLDFGTINPTNGVVIPLLGSINVTCSLGTSFSVGLGDGANVTGTQRRMHRNSSTDYLQYELYKDLLGTSRFGNAVTSERMSLPLGGLGILPTPVLFYGTVAANQAAGAGAYSDTVQITVYF
jgi:spore coat protein U-like protein